MQHVKPTSKGDPLCPLGFHPQVRWPTRCKRCFRDYKEHGNRSKDQDSQLRKDELTVSTPALSTYSSRSRNDPKLPDSTLGSRTWTSSSNLSSLGTPNKPHEDSFSNRTNSSASSWTSSPNLADNKEDAPVATVSLTLPRRRPRPVEEETVEDDPRRTEFTVRRRTVQVAGTNSYEPVSTSLRRSSTPISNTSKVTSLNNSSSTSVTPTYRSRALSSEENKQKAEVDFMLQVKAAPKVPSTAAKPYRSRTSDRAESSDSEDDASITNTDTTETTLVNENQEEIESLKKELEVWKSRCEKAEREKSDFLMRRLTVDSTSSRASASEVLKLQQKVNELKSNNEDLRDEKKSLSQKVRELEANLEGYKASGAQKEVQMIKEKLNAAESLCEELMDANEEMKREIRDMEEEMDEMQDKFREDRADEYTSLKKELEQATKNCRILSFKLRKAERRAEQLDAEKMEAERKCREVAGGQSGLDKLERIKQLEHELSVANEAASRLQKDLEEANSKLKNENNNKINTIPKKKAPKLGSTPKTPSGEKMSRESLTRGDSQEDPVQLLRDLQDSLEREADLREQLRFSEEEILRLQVKRKMHICTPDILSNKSKVQKNIYKSVTEGLNLLGLQDSPPSDEERNFNFIKIEKDVQCDKIENCSQFSQTDILKYEANENEDKFVQCDIDETNDIGIQVNLSVETNDQMNQTDDLNSDNSNVKGQNSALFDLNPCLNSKLISFGSLLPHTHVLSPLGALFLSAIGNRTIPSLPHYKYNNSRIFKIMNIVLKL